MADPGPWLERRIAEVRIYQSKETHAFALADKLVGDLETHPAAKGVSCEKIGSVRLYPSDFGDVIGSHRLDRTGEPALSIQRQWLQAKYRTLTLKIAKQMMIVPEPKSDVYKEKWQTCPGNAKRHQ